MIKLQRYGRVFGTAYEEGYVDTLKEVLNKVANAKDRRGNIDRDANIEAAIDSIDKLIDSKLEADDIESKLRKVRDTKNPTAAMKKLQKYGRVYEPTKDTDYKEALDAALGSVGEDNFEAATSCINYLRKTGLETSDITPMLQRVGNTLDSDDAMEKLQKYSDVFGIAYEEGYVNTLREALGSVGKDNFEAAIDSIDKLESSGLKVGSIVAIINFSESKSIEEKINLFEEIAESVNDSDIDLDELNNTITEVYELEDEDSDLIKTNFAYLIKGLDEETFMELKNEMLEYDEDENENKIVLILKEWNGNATSDSDEINQKNAKLINTLLKCGFDISDMANTKEKDICALRDINFLEKEGSKGRDIETILKQIHVKSEDINVIHEQLRTLDSLSALNYLQTMIKTYNNEAKVLGESKVDEINILDIKANKGRFTGRSKDDLQKIWDEAYDKTGLDKDTQDFLNRVQAYANTFGSGIFDCEGKKIKKDLNNQTEQLKTEQEKFNKNNKILNNFVNEHYNRARDAANFLDRLDDAESKIEHYKALRDQDKHNKIYREKLYKAKEERKKILSEDEHHFSAKNDAELKVVTTAMYLLAAIMVAACVLTVISALPIAITTGLAALAFIGSNVYVHTFYARDAGYLRNRAQEQLDKSNKTLGVAIGQEVIRAKQVGLDKSEVFNAEYDNVKKNIGNNLQLAKLKGKTEEMVIKSKKLKKVSGEMKELKRIGDMSAFDKYTKKHLEDTDKIKKNLLTSLGSLSSEPSDSLHRIEIPKVSTKDGRLNRDLLGK